MILLPVDSADMDTWVESLPLANSDNEPCEINVEITVDGLVVQGTSAVKPNRRPSWNEEIIV